MFQRFQIISKTFFYSTVSTNLYTGMNSSSPGTILSTGENIPLLWEEPWDTGVNCSTPKPEIVSTLTLKGNLNVLWLKGLLTQSQVTLHLWYPLNLDYCKMAELHLFYPHKHLKLSIILNAKYVLYLWNELLVILLESQNINLFFRIL